MNYTHNYPNLCLHTCTISQSKLVNYFASTVQHSALMTELHKFCFMVNLNGLLLKKGFIGHIRHLPKNPILCDVIKSILTCIWKFILTYYHFIHVSCDPADMGKIKYNLCLFTLLRPIGKKVFIFWCIMIVRDALLLVMYEQKST